MTGAARRKRARAEKNARSNLSMDGECGAARNVHHESVPTPFYCFRCQEIMTEMHWYEWQTSAGQLTVCVDCNGYLSNLHAQATGKVPAPMEKNVEKNKRMYETSEERNARVQERVEAKRNKQVEQREMRESGKGYGKSSGSGGSGWGPYGKGWGKAWSGW
eukprot:TRINITY_DN20745_c0_g1_i1.p2 TRINITY_DN20745_c0_g1~~TRINITY_DN20745_c0_g1_i1.p2  ORF type:complete len:161 (-),score=30.90 TRINITY_DN20745_c0_g1_i1:139-621(-)